MPRRPRPWRGSLRAHKGWILLSVKDSSGDWVERSTGEPDTPAGWAAAEKIRADAVAKLQAREAATGSTAAPTVEGFAHGWVKERGLDAANDESRLRLHVFPSIGPMLLEDVQPRHLAALAKEWAPLAPRTRRNVYSVLKALFRDARIAGVLQGPDPCILTHRQLGKVRDAKRGWRQNAIFTRDELQGLLADDRLSLAQRVWYGLLGVGMLRTGEAAGLRWGKLQPAEPLGRIVVDTSYDRGRTKTEDERWMPIHPSLAALLAEWKLGGWAQLFGRPPAAGDLVCPCPPPTTRGPRKPAGAMRDKNWARKRFVKDLAALQLRHRRAHDLRRTGISLAQDDGADRSILRWGTHAPPREVFDLYTTLQWSTLCREIGKLQVSARMIRAGSGSSGPGAGVDPC
jgi:integrase